ncbi:PH domain-containing protein [Methanothermobacter sp.]|uniref:PH domain-containing protein n=1 Tax=Methanothermobacter sp. TaxID=1884223 RepID=UPI00262543F4|nr:PH domain-containing protein [Methanothermobacter sp.]MDI9618325.1 PH domain-containing protein [Methanothermobacter sp.]
MFGRERLYPGERVLYETGPRFILNSKSSIIKILFLALIIYIFPAAVKFAGDLDNVLIVRYGFTVAEKVVWILTTAFIILVLSVLWDMISWRSRRYIITDRRVIVESGVLRKRRFYINHSKIVDVSFSQGIIERLLNSADIEIHGGHEDTHIILEDAPSPAKIEYHINRFTGERTVNEAEEILRELSSERHEGRGFADPKFWEDTDEFDESNLRKSPVEEGGSKESIMERHSRKFKRFRKEGRDD